MYDSASKKFADADYNDTMTMNAVLPVLRSIEYKVFTSKQFHLE